MLVSIIFKDTSIALISVGFLWENDLNVLDLGSAITDRRTHSKLSCLIGMLCSQKSLNTFAVLDVMKKAFRLKGKLYTRDWPIRVLLN